VVVRHWRAGCSYKLHARFGEGWLEKGHVCATSLASYSTARTVLRRGEYREVPTYATSSPIGEAQSERIGGPFAGPSACGATTPRWCRLAIQPRHVARPDNPDAASSRHTGLGLGLFICQELAGRTVGASRSRPRRERERHSPCGCRCWRRATGLTHSAPLLDCRPTLSRRRPRETPARREAPGAGGGRGRLRPNQSHRPCAGRFVHPCDGRMNKTASTRRPRAHRVWAASGRARRDRRRLDVHRGSRRPRRSHGHATPRMAWSPLRCPMLHSATCPSDAGSSPRQARGMGRGRLLLARRGRAEERTAYRTGGPLGVR